MPRAQDKALVNAFLREASVTNFTMDSSVSIGGPIELLQIQFDTITGPTDTSFEIDNSGQSVKSGAFSAGAGTREVTFMGRIFHIDSYLEITRPVGDSHDMFVTLVYYER
jgi:hypothetical protein